MNNIKTFEQYNESILLLAGGALLLGVFFKKLLKDIKDFKYRSIINKVLADNTGETRVYSEDNTIKVSTVKYFIIIDKIHKTANFFKKSNSSLMPVKVKGGKMTAVCDYPLKLTIEQYKFLIENLKKKEAEINEEADYRNVSGYGTMGNSSDQRAGPSFNKGPMSATYRQPTVIGTESGYIEDPYFAGRGEKVQKKKINRDLVNMRKKKYRVLKKQDVDTRKKMIS